MSPQRMKTRQNHSQPQAQYTQQQSDYDTDYNNYNSDAPVPASSSRTGGELNLSVLQRHNPSVTSVISIAHYAVLYLFSPETQEWEKHGVEGTLFICQLTSGELGEERYSVIILNRRGLDNFSAELRSSSDVEITEEYVILYVQPEVESENAKIFGFWIFSEPAPSSTAEARTINAQIMQDCAAHAEASRKQAEHVKLQQESTDGDGPHQISPEVSPEEAVPMGRQLSLRELFGQQREQDAGFSVHNHHSPPVHPAQPAQLAQPARFTPTADTMFFRTPAAPPGQQAPRQAGDIQNGQENVLLSLFNQARKA